MHSDVVTGLTLLRRWAFWDIGWACGLSRGTIGWARLIQELFGRWNHRKALLGKMPVESQGSTDRLISHQYEGCCVHNGMYCQAVE